MTAQQPAQGCKVLKLERWDNMALQRSCRDDGVAFVLLWNNFVKEHEYAQYQRAFNNRGKGMGLYRK